MKKGFMLMAGAGAFSVAMYSAIKLVCDCFERLADGKDSVQVLRVFTVFIGFMSVFCYFLMKMCFDKSIEACDGCESLECAVFAFDDEFED